MTSDIHSAGHTSAAVPTFAELTAHATPREIYDEHYETYRGFVLGVGLFTAHVAVILIILAMWLL